MNMEHVKVLAEIVNINGLTKLEICEGDTKISIEKMMQSEMAHIPKVTTSIEQLSSVDHHEMVDFNRITEVKSPIVGVFYAAPSPDVEPFVTIGSKVKKGDVLCIVEAMKLMNEITAECDGEIVDICVKNGEITEFGQVLFKIF
jgi:acetyl-CoA carboxylase biotin carboxyl carrier protein